MRKYKSGTRWCVWRWTETDSQYLTRLHLIKTPWFSVCLHWIKKPDPEPDLHDHPVSFLSLILRGGYTEVRKKPNLKQWFYTHKWFNFIRASREDRHRIIAVWPKTLTLCFMGPIRRTWGFHTANGWVPWKVYNAKYKNNTDREWVGGVQGRSQSLPTTAN